MKDATRRLTIILMIWLAVLVVASPAQSHEYERSWEALYHESEERAHRAETEVLNLEARVSELEYYNAKLKRKLEDAEAESLQERLDRAVREATRCYQ